MHSSVSSSQSNLPIDTQLPIAEGEHGNMQPATSSADPMVHGHQSLTPGRELTDRTAENSNTPGGALSQLGILTLPGAFHPEYRDTISPDASFKQQGDTDPHQYTVAEVIKERSDDEDSEWHNEQETNFAEDDDYDLLDDLDTSQPHESLADNTTQNTSTTNSATSSKNVLSPEIEGPDEFNLLDSDPAQATLPVARQRTEVPAEKVDIEKFITNNSKWTIAKKIGLGVCILIPPIGLLALLIKGIGFISDLVTIGTDFKPTKTIVKDIDGKKLPINELAQDDFKLALTTQLTSIAGIDSHKIGIISDAINDLPLKVTVYRTPGAGSCMLDALAMKYYYEKTGKTPDELSFSEKRKIINDFESAARKYLHNLSKNDPDRLNWWQTNSFKPWNPLCWFTGIAGILANNPFNFTFMEPLQLRLTDRQIYRISQNLQLTDPCLFTPYYSNEASNALSESLEELKTKINKIFQEGGSDDHKQQLISTAIANWANGKCLTVLHEGHARFATIEVEV